MKKTSRKILCVMLCVMLCVSSVIPVFASGGLSIADIIKGAISSGLGSGSGSATGDDLGDMISQMITGGSLGDVNIAELLAKKLEGEINKESPAKQLIDKIISNIKNGVPDDGSDDPSVEVDKEALNYAVQLFNLTVNRIKQEKPYVVKSENSGLSQALQEDIKEQWMPVLSAIASSVVKDKSLIPAVIGSMSDSTAVSKRLPNGVSHDNDMPLSGTPYVSTIKPEQVKNFSMTIHKSGAYSIRLDLPTVYGSPIGTGYDALYDVTDNSTFKVNLTKGLSMDTPVFIKYINSYAEVNVNRKGNISGYRVHIECTASLADENGKNPIGLKPDITSAFDFEEMGLVYVMEETYTGFNWEPRKMGDINNDNKVSAADARLALRAAAKIDKLEGADRDYADIDRNGEITPADARKILRAASMVDTLPNTADVMTVDTTVKDKNQTAVDNLLIVILAAEADRKNNQTNEPSSETTTSKIDPGSKDETTTKKNYADDINNGAQFIKDIFSGLFQKK